MISGLRVILRPTDVKKEGSIYVLTPSLLATYNPFNKTLITLCDNKTIISENQWVWFAGIDPKYIISEMLVTPDDCSCLPDHQ